MSSSSSTAPTFPKPLPLPLPQDLLESINAHLSNLTPEEILKWGVEHLPNLHQTTAFGLTGLVAIDMLSKLTDNPPPLIFLDTLYHFPETYELVEEVKQKYGYVGKTAQDAREGKRIYVYRPEGCDTVAEFEKEHGEKLWERDEDKYDFLIKVEPARRAYQDLNVQSVITGRRASQGADRANLPPLEVDSTGLLKLNPLFAWTFEFVQWYVNSNNVPRNKLLDQGYKSIGDWHSTQKVGEGEGERAGRWKGRDKTECGLHKDYWALKAKATGADAAASESQAQAVAVSA
ncbi:phosphoadenylyl-sulfate reductase [Coprinopsis cinerea okayama7|uniref:Phosphoadenylyl-sulfate reductase n=1 Tax=Coprinopsis cinerea (strain Okayama-7 / 130 / ATCC MYA-4618 / FGSC 9003) TaxID=240176 RepID=A8NZ68_COPC7|nr:phosphoadenylyl-sulfate reductase [Coprinopsis cinerea okayama7\|eukprot:XP_001837618.1 phosphoadenylyl-sulfate reductase [Coprinopsis cinerea okayama7\